MVKRESADDAEPRTGAAAIPSGPILIQPEALYDAAALRHLLGLAEGTLVKGRREENLRHVTKGTRTFYMGAWVLEWLERGGVSRG
jgi:hypothetical protein